MRYLTLDKAIEAWRKLQPLSDEDRARLSRRFTIDFNYNSNHLEGNTLTYGQTEILLLFGKVIGEANLKDVQDMTASNVTLNMMKEEATIKETPLTQAFIRTLHKTLLREDYTVYRNLPGGMQTSYTVHAGQYKTRPNSVITRYGDRFEYASPEEPPALMTDLVDWYNKAEAEGKLSPVELAVLFHYRYIRIHPFEDGNGRIARLLVNYILTKHDYPMIVVRSRLKNEYLEALHAADLMVGSSPCAGAKASTTPATDFSMIRTRGMRIIRVTVQKVGSFDLSDSSGLIPSGGGMKYFFPQKAPQTGPATIMAAIPQTIPIIITHPRSTPSIVATSTGPGVGGMKAWPTARPARSGVE